MSWILILDALQGFPDNCDTIQVAKGTANLIKRDIFKNLMWYMLPDSNKQYPLTIERVKKIKSLNAQGIIPEELEAVEITSSKPKEVEPEFVDVVGHISLPVLKKRIKKEGSKINKGNSSNRKTNNKANSQIRQPGNQQQKNQPQKKQPPPQQRPPQKRK